MNVDDPNNTAAVYVCGSISIDSPNFVCKQWTDLSVCVYGRTFECVINTVYMNIAKAKEEGQAKGQ